MFCACGNKNRPSLKWIKKNTTLKRESNDCLVNNYNTVSLNDSFKIHDVIQNNSLYYSFIRNACKVIKKVVISVTGKPVRVRGPLNPWIKVIGVLQKA